MDPIILPFGYGCMYSGGTEDWMPMGLLVFGKKLPYVVFFKKNIGICCVLSEKAYSAEI